MVHVVIKFHITGKGGTGTNTGSPGKKHKCRHRFTSAQNVYSTSIAKTRSTDENINSHGDFPKYHREPVVDLRNLKKMK